MSFSLSRTLIHLYISFFYILSTRCLIGNTIDENHSECLHSKALVLALLFVFTVVVDKSVCIEIHSRTPTNKSTLTSADVYICKVCSNGLSKSVSMCYLCAYSLSCAAKVAGDALNVSFYMVCVRCVYV